MEGLKSDMAAIVLHMDVNEDRLGLRSLRHIVDGFVCM